jgi:hypothetical protein
MPQLVTFHGRPVKRRRRFANRLRLTFVGAIPGEPGKVVFVSQEEWQRFGAVRFFPKHEMPNVRALADQFVS